MCTLKENRFIIKFSGPTVLYMLPKKGEFREILLRDSHTVCVCVCVCVCVWEGKKVGGKAVNEILPLLIK